MPLMLLWIFKSLLSFVVLVFIGKFYFCFLLYTLRIKLILFQWKVLFLFFIHQAVSYLVGNSFFRGVLWAYFLLLLYSFIFSMNAVVSKKNLVIQTKRKFSPLSCLLPPLSGIRVSQQTSVLILKAQHGGC